MGSSNLKQLEDKLFEVKKTFRNQENLRLLLDHDAELRMKNHSNSGRLQYAIVLQRLDKFTVKNFKDYTERDLKDFFADIKPTGFYADVKKELSPRTRWIYMCLAKSFFTWLHNAKDDEPPVVVRWIKRSKYIGASKKLLPSDIPAPEDILKMVNISKHIRDKALIFALFESGCRVNSEFLEVKIKDLTVNDRYSSFDIKGNVKTSHSKRTCYLIRSWPLVRQWIDNHPQRDNSEAHIWVNTRGKNYGARMSDDSVARLVEKTAKSAGLKIKMWPHLLRHARALECAKQGYSNQVMNKIFGWSDASDMSNWYVSLSQSDVRDVVLEKSGMQPPKDTKNTKALELLTCPRCSKQWSAGTKFCTCGAVLDLQTALEINETKQKDDVAVTAMMQRMVQMQQSMQGMFEEINRLKLEKQSIEEATK